MYVLAYRHGDQQKKTSRDATKISGIVKAARPSVHSNGSYSSSYLQQAAAAFSHSSSVPEVVRVDTNGGKAGISSVQSTGLINASITNTTPNSFAQSKHPKASIPTFKTSSNEQNLDAPDTQSVDVCSPVTKATWNHLPEFPDRTQFQVAASKSRCFIWLRGLTASRYSDKWIKQ